MPIVRGREKRFLVEYLERPALTNDRSNLVLLHGWGCSPKFFLPLMESLPPRFHARALNLLYYGSGCPATEATIRGFATLVAGLIGNAPTILAGHSMGGVIAQAVAIGGAPVEKLILIGTGPNMKDHSLGARILDDAETSGISKEFLEATMRRFFKDAPSDLSEYMEDVSRGDPAVMLSAMKSLFATDLEPELSKIKCPALILHGRHDAARNMNHVDRLMKSIPQSRLVLFDTGHSPMLEAPDEFNRHFINFLD